MLIAPSHWTGTPARADGEAMGLHGRNRGALGRFGEPVTKTEGATWPNSCRLDRLAD
jgi:hypothetical protein